MEATKALILEMAYFRFPLQYLSKVKKLIEGASPEDGLASWEHGLQFLREVIKYYTESLEVLQPGEISFAKVLEFEKASPGWSKLSPGDREIVERFTKFLDDNKMFFGSET